jgi:hypothetical protein
MLEKQCIIISANVEKRYVIDAENNEDAIEKAITFFTNFITEDGEDCNNILNINTKVSSLDEVLNIEEE